MAALQGKVIHGDSIGKKLGYPTANLNIPRDSIQLGDGVYAGWSVLKGKKYKSAIVIMNQPVKVEVYLVDYTEGDFYGEKIAIDFVQKISEVERYEDEKELIKKIERDLKLVREVLKI